MSQLIDAVIIAGSLWLVCWLYGMSWREQYNVVAGCGVGLFLFFSYFYGVYQDWKAGSVQREFVRVWLTWFTVVLGLLLLAYAFKTSAEYSRKIFLTWFVLLPLLLMVWRGWHRIAVGAVRKHGFHAQNVAIVGAQALGVNLAQTILDAPWMGLRPVGFYDDRTPSGGRPLAQEPLQVMGNLNALVKHARNGKVDQIFIALPLSAEKRIKSLLAKLSDTTASVYVVPDFFVFDLLNARWANIGDLPVVSIFETPFYGIDSWVKRSEDIIVASLILLFIALPMIAIAIGVKLSSPGPVIFRQNRYGLRGEKMEVWKFRTMKVIEEDAAVIQATKEDPRVTRFGAFLRSSSLDELPQFINVLQGRMSVVGPRPHALVHNEQYRKLIHGYMLRHKVKPGITGLAQVQGWRGQTEVIDKMEKRIEYDLAYIQNWSLWLDLKIIFKTLLVGFSSKGAY
ncbi:MAG: undecaprenyl-phosphate glucose phosphotransferase [Acidiferrobacterales bacterium]